MTEQSGNFWRQGREIQWGLLPSREALLAEGDLKQISSCLQRKSGVINLARCNSVFVNTSLMFHLGDNKYFQICSFTTLTLYFSHCHSSAVQFIVPISDLSSPQNKTHNHKDNRFKGPTGANSTPTRVNTILFTLSFTFKEEDQSCNPQRCCVLLFLILAPLFCRCCYIFHCQKNYLNQKVMNTFIQTNDYSSPEIQKDSQKINQKQVCYLQCFSHNEFSHKFCFPRLTKYWTCFPLPTSCCNISLL